MSIPASAVGTVLAPVTATVEHGRLRFFAEAIGQTQPQFIDGAAAAAAGYPGLPVPPTFLFGLKMDGSDPFRWLTDLGVDLRHVLHGSQRFDYQKMAFAGDVLDFRSRIADVFEKRGGSLEFIILETAVTCQRDTIATLVETLVIRHPELEVAR